MSLRDVEEVAKKKAYVDPSGFSHLDLNIWILVGFTETLLLQCIGPKQDAIHSFSSLSYDRSKASSKASSPHSAI